jgi:hypothetical protein
MNGRSEMRDTSLFALAAAVMATGFGLWAASPINAGAPSMGQGIEPFQLMLNANNLPNTEFATTRLYFVERLD